MHAAAPKYGFTGFTGVAAGDGRRGGGVKGLASVQQATVVAAIALAHAAGLWALLGHALRPAASAPARPVAMVMLLDAAPAAVAAPQPVQPPAPAQPRPRASPPAPPKRPPSPPPPEPATAVVPAVAEPMAAPPAPPSSDTASAIGVAVASPAAAEGGASAAAPAPKIAAAPGVTRQIDVVDYLRAPVLEYPSASRRFGEQGRVVLRVLVGVDGQAERIEVLEPSAFRRLTDAAIEAARRALYKPYAEDGVHKPAWAIVALSFQLKR